MESKYDPDAFFSAERYPLPMKCSECGKTMRPVHKHCTPDMPRTYFCTFCGVGIYEDNPGIRFSRKPTNADRIRAMSDEELAEWICQETTNALNLLSFGNGKPSKSFFTWLEWLKEASE